LLGFFAGLKQEDKREDATKLVERMARRLGLQAIFQGLQLDVLLVVMFL